VSSIGIGRSMKQIKSLSRDVGSPIEPIDFELHNVQDKKI
jgi:hypothetical protein